MSKAKWTKVSSSEIIEERRTGPHRWKNFKSKFLPWAYCGNCGLILLNNAPCQIRAKKPCTG